MPDDLGRPTAIRIGATSGTRADVKIVPHIEFLPGQIDVTLCGAQRHVGFPRCRWTYPDRELTGEQFYQLKSLVGENASATVYIDVPTQTLDISTYTPVVASYEAIMNWPEEGVIQGLYERWLIPDDGIVFTNLRPIP